MLIPFDISEKWDGLNQRLQKDLKVNESNVVKVHPGIIPALREITLGLSQLFPHKMTIVFQPKVAHYVDESIKGFTRLGYKTLPLDGKELPKDTLAVIVANDHPISGELYEHAMLAQGLNEKKIFLIRLSHSVHRFRPAPEAMKPYELTVYAFSEYCALSIGGERFKFQTYFSPYLKWDEVSDIKFNDRREKKEEVLAFEGQLPAGAKPYFEKSASRLYDRSLISWKEYDGLSIVNEMKAGSGLETLSACRWGDVQVFRPYLSPDVSDEDYRGMVIIGSELVSPKLKDRFEEVIKKIKVLQEG